MLCTTGREACSKSTVRTAGGALHYRLGDLLKLWHCDDDRWCSTPLDGKHASEYGRDGRWVALRCGTGRLMSGCALLSSRDASHVAGTSLLQRLGVGKYGPPERHASVCSSTTGTADRACTLVDLYREASAFARIGRLPGMLCDPGGRTMFCTYSYAMLSNSV